jgi:hypothetical protein
MTRAIRTPSQHLPQTVRSWVRTTRYAATFVRDVPPVLPSPNGNEPWPLT